MALNATWHRAHPMPKNPTEAQRVAWHSEHAEVCGCREMPENLRRKVQAFRRAQGGGDATDRAPPRKPAAAKRDPHR